MNFKVNESATKLRGGYYTPADLAHFLTRWVLAINPKRILEPSCGDGVFLQSLSEFKYHADYFKGFETEPAEASKARRKSSLLPKTETSISEQDFLDWALLNLSRPLKFDAVVGNPPFIRYQYLEKASQLRAEKLFSIFKLHFTKHTNAWVPFVLAGIAHLRPGGRLAMVVPAEILHVLHAQSVREYLAATCSRILVIDPQELWFDALQGAVLLLAEKKTEAIQAEAGIAVLRVYERSFLQKDPEDCFQRADFMKSSEIATKWMIALLSKDERQLVDDLSKHPQIARFGDIAKVDVGIVTGANKFFLVTDEIVRNYGLDEWSYPMFGRSGHARGVIYDNRDHQENRALGLPCNFLWFEDEDLKDYPKKVREYILEGERSGLPGRYKCSVRSPWYSVPSVYTAPVAMLKRCHDYPRTILNNLKAYTTDTAYRIIPKKVSSSALVYGFLNSLTALSAELEGRHYGGGVLELVPSEIERLLIPLCPEPNGEMRQLDHTVRDGGPAERILAAQDAKILGGIGISRAQIDMLSGAWLKLRNRRQRSELASEIENNTESGTNDLAASA